MCEEAWCCSFRSQRKWVTVVRSVPHGVLLLCDRSAPEPSWESYRTPGTAGCGSRDVTALYPVSGLRFISGGLMRMLTEPYAVCKSADTFICQCYLTWFLFTSQLLVGTFGDDRYYIRSLINVFSKHGLLDLTFGKVLNLFAKARDVQTYQEPPYFSRIFLDDIEGFQCCI